MAVCISIVHGACYGYNHQHAMFGHSMMGYTRAIEPNLLVQVDEFFQETL
jgi:hypothetical protein